MNMTILPAFSIGLLLAGGLGAAPVAAPADAPAGPDVLLRCHFSGLTSLLADPQAAKLKQIWSLPSTADVKKQALDKLARAPYLALSEQLGRGVSDQVALFRPLLDDLLPGESFLEWRGPEGQPTEFALALQLDEARARVWRENLRQALEKWKLGTIAETKANGAEGWALKHRDGKSVFAYARAGQWVVIGLGPANLPLQAQMLQRVKAEGRPGPKLSGHWLVADANLDRLKDWLPPLAPYAHPPRAHLIVSNQADYVRTTVQLHFPQGHGWKSEPWSIPTNFIRDPLISFTAVQGLAPLLRPWKWFQQLAFAAPPSQAFVWAQADNPFLTQWAVPLKGAGQELTRLTPRLQGMITTNRDIVLPASVVWDTNTYSLAWRGLPAVVPQLTAVRTRQTDYLLGGLLPRILRTNAAPAELFQQVMGRPGLLYYDWEVTEPRLIQWRPLLHLADIAMGRAFVSTNAPTARWLLAVAPLLGNTVTEVTAASPTQLTLVRKSHGGFTGFEIVCLTRWLDSPRFPRWTIAGPEAKMRPPGKGKSR